MTAELFTSINSSASLIGSLPSTRLGRLKLLDIVPPYPLVLSMMAFISACYTTLSEE